MKNVYTIKRAVNNRGINKELKKPYCNMEEKLKEYYDNQVKLYGDCFIYLEDEPDTPSEEQVICKPEKCIGRILSIRDTNMLVELPNNKFTEEEIESMKVAIGSVITEYKRFLKVNKIIKIVLRSV